MSDKIESSKVMENLSEHGRVSKPSREKLLSALLEGISLGVVVLNSKQVVVEANDRSVELLDYEDESVVGLNLRDLIIEGQQEELREAIESSEIGCQTVPVILSWEKADKRKTLLEFGVRRIVEAEGEEYVLLVIRDVVEDMENRAERSHLIRAIEQVGESVVVMDARSTIQYVNPVFEKTIGYSRDEIIGKHPRFFMSDEQDESLFEELWNTLARGDVWNGRLINKRKDGSLLIEEAVISAVHDEAGRVVNYVSVQRDVTHESELEKHLQQTQKLESVGTLAGGIAHDFNNILQTILGFNEMAMSIYTGESEKLVQCFHEIESGGRRGVDLVKQILTFSRTSKIEYTPISMRSIVDEAIRFLRSLMPTSIRIVSMTDSHRGLVLGDSTQIHQVVTNLCTNAMHAMEGNGGTLTVSLKPIRIDSPVATFCGTLVPADYMELAVSDTGEGIRPELIEKILDPFFTTKEAGKGTGLGLAMVHGIAKSMGGGLMIESELGKGTTISLKFPLLGSNDAEEVVKGVKPSGQLDVGTRKHALIVDDEKAIVELTTMLLEHLGFSVEAHTEVDGALQALRRDPSAFDLIISDYTMPEKTGLELANDIYELNPDVPVVLATGLIDPSELEDSKPLNIVEVIKKPFKLEDLVVIFDKIFNTRV